MRTARGRLVLIVSCLAIVIVVIGILAGAKPAMAHGSYNTSDEDHDGNSVIRFYRPAHFRKHFGAGIVALNSLAEKPGSHAPHWRYTSSLAKAEVIIRYAPANDRFASRFGCGNSTYIHNPGPDYIYLDRSCPGYRTPMMHEGGHGLGMVHHENCTKPVTVMYPSRCHPKYWTTHDVRYARNIVEGT